MGRTGCFTTRWTARTYAVVQETGRGSGWGVDSLVAHSSSRYLLMSGKLSRTEFENFFHYYIGEQQQRDAVGVLYDGIRRDAPYLLSEDHHWVKLYRSDSTTNKFWIDKVPYFSQHDNVSGTGYRECFSSSCAMVAAFYGKVKTDDQYNSIRSQFGDTTDAHAQLRTLRSLGLQASFSTTATAAKLKEVIRDGMPVPVGWLHHGTANAPRGGGHWSVLVGYDDSGWYHNDPNGEADLVNGGYVSYSNGAGMHYSDKNWMPRWNVNDMGGWCLFVTP